MDSQAPTSTKSVIEYPWRIAALVSVFANVTFNVISGRVGTPSPTVADISDKHATLFTPAGFAFGIWGLIYGATLLYAVSALLPRQLDVRMHDRIAPWLLATSALSSLWVVCFTTEHFVPSLLIIAAIFTCTVAMYTIASDHLVSEHLSHFWRLPFGLWMSWLGVATLANLCVTLQANDVPAWPFSAAVWTAILLGFAGLVAVSVGAVFLDPVIPLVVSWATAAIAVAHWEDSAVVAVVAALVALKTLLLGVRLLAFSNLPLPSRERERLERDLRVMPPHSKHERISVGA
jgi:benzodiazapine receptor